MKDYDIECPQCGDVMGGRLEESDNPDVKYIYEAGCVECCVIIEHSYPTEEYQKKVHDYLLGKTGDENG